MPLKTPSQIDEFCKPNEIYLETCQQPDLWVPYKVLCKHFFTNRKNYRGNKILKYIDHAIAAIQKPFIKKKKEYGCFYGGSALWSIPFNFAAYVDSLRDAIKVKYRFSLAADEVFMQTICMNSHFKGYISNFGNCRLIEGQRVRSNSPKTWTIKDVGTIQKGMKRENILFARKFNCEIDPLIVDYIKENVF